MPPPKAHVLTKMEELIHHFIVVTEGLDAPPGEIYFGAENPKGELGFYINSKGGGVPHRLKIRAPSFVNLSILPEDPARPHDERRRRHPRQSGLRHGRMRQMKIDSMKSQNPLLGLLLAAFALLLVRRVQSQHAFRFETDERKLRSDHAGHVEGTGGDNPRAADHRGNEGHDHLQENDLPLRGWQEIRHDHFQERRSRQQGHQSRA